MELILVDDEEPIPIEEKTKQEEKGVSLTKTNRREPGKNSKRGTTSVKGAMRERREKTKLQDSKNKPKQPSKKQEWTQENKEGSPHKNRKNHN